MMINHYVHNLVQAQRYEAVRRDAEQWGLARELGVVKPGILRSLGARFRVGSLQRPAPRNASRDDALIRLTRYGSE